jgi:hypothetical protein
MKLLLYFFVGVGRFFARVFKEVIKDMVEEGRK